MEYSALVRDRSGEGRFVRMTALKIRRRAIMSLLFGGEHRVAVAPPADVTGRDIARSEVKRTLLSVFARPFRQGPRRVTVLRRCCALAIPERHSLECSGFQRLDIAAVLTGNGQ